MKISIIGKDMRFEYLSRILGGAGHEITEDAGSAQLIICGYPGNIEHPAGARVAYCGPGTAPAGSLDIMKDEKYLRRVAYLTAEGAVASAMASTPHTIRDARCMVVGWGRIGRELTGLLQRIGAQVTVLTRRESAVPDILASGAQSEPTGAAAEVIAGHSIIFSTPPAMVLDAAALSRADKGAAIIDLASPPYGVDLDYARKNNIHAWRESALPGRYCPENAAQAIYSALVRGGAFNG